MYDAIFVGGGLNYAGAIVLAKKGKKVALIEKNMKELGGVCLHHGCIPSKNLLHRAKTAYEIKEDVFSRHKDALKFELLQSKIQEHLKKSTDSITLQCKSAGVELIESEGFVSDKGVMLDDKVLSSRYIIIGTGSSAFIPKEIEIDYKNIITSKEALKLQTLPKEIMIYGSGAIGVEFATFFAINGVKTTLVYRHDKISRKIHPRLIEKIEEQLKNIGVILMPKSTISKAKSINDEVEVYFEDGKKITTKKLLVATGRVPNTGVVKSNLIKINRGIATDEYFETSMQNVFAIGDCNGKLQLAHAARAEVLNVVKNILGKKSILNLANIPRFIFTLPLSYAFTGSRGVKEASFPLSYLGITGSVAGANLGEVILYTDKDDFVCGAEMFTPNAEELIGIFSTALAAELDVKTFKKAVFPHPTFSESIDRVLRRV
jgi:dihydrolipoamide dehydrogenase